ncbi:DUF5686 and carboxypeptidase regulatory-like domain-containing protein [Taibaiella helva]|uniref:DUF5686 and carboxypeptidase regulatory-like domain-containing protein n=1 Tax=Taibaiella helva TaxID=2301235 RepID=UPI000E57A351|nr:DUF5686 and carboxypeptidase regulatory-like domain-containing protein [Taibaiella helva]
MIKKQMTATLLLLLTGNILFAAVIKGRVTDENGEGLAFATVLEKGTTNGTSANGDGYYTLELSDGAHNITAQYIGYQPQTRQVNTASVKEVNFKLNPQTLEVREVTVKANGEDPAYPIMRKVIEKRKYHADLIRTFETDVYLKGVLRMRSTPKKLLGIKLSEEDYKEMNEGAGLDSAGKGVLYLLEQYTQYTYKAPSKEYNRVVSIRQSGDPQGVGFATMPPITNIYDNNVPIMQGLNKRGFISPANSNAFLYYKYKFLGSYLDGDRMINKIQVIPKRKFEPVFSGYVYVVDDEWVFQSVDLRLTKEAQMDLLDTLKLEQTYIPIAKDLWIIQSQVIYPVLSLMGFEAAGNFVTSYKNQKVNQPVDERRFAGRVISSYDTAANDRSIAYWDTIRPIPLEADEVRDFKVKDSLYTFQKTKADSLNKIPHTNLGVSAFLYGGPSIRRGKDTWTMQPLISAISYNTVEGLNATLDLAWTHRFNKDKTLTTELLNRYGFSNKHYNALLKMNYTVSDPKWRGRSWRFRLEGGQYIYQLNNDNPITPFINMSYTLFGGDNYMKIYESRLGKLSVYRNWGNGFKASLGASYEQRMPLENTADYTFGDSKKKNLTPNQPATLPLFEEHKAAIVTASVSYQPGWSYIQYPKYKSPVGSNAPVFTARYTKGIPNLFDSKSDFDKWSVEMEHSLNLRLLGTVNYRLVGGGFFNDNYVGIPDMKHLFGNQTFLANPYLNSFQLAPYYRFSNTADLYGQGHLEWHLNGWLTNKIPLFRRLNWHLVGGSNVLYIDQDNYYAEVFAGLENIGFKMFRFGRVDLVAGYESGRGKPSVGVRIGLGEVLWQILGISNGRGE